MNKSPIFIHSLFRSGSTYLFKVFRRSATGYWCYQEPLHEIPVFAKDQPDRLIAGFGSAEMELNRHPAMERPYFQELFDTWPTWKNAVDERFVYEAYFADTVQDSDIGIVFWRALIDAAQGLPVFQECRTAGRIAAIKRQLGGFHLYLWRNPWDQWWSYKATPYFDVANQLIINARHVPGSVRRMRGELNLATYPGNDLAGAFSFYSGQLLTSEQSYLVFYLLWCLAMHEGVEHADLLLSIDRLSDSEQYRHDIVSQLSDAGIGGIDFFDCHVPQARYLSREIEFFDRLEKKVHLWLEDDGWTTGDLDRVRTLREQYQPASWSVPIHDLAPEDLAEQALRARELAIRSESSAAERTFEARAQLGELDARLVAAGVAAQHEESLLNQAEAKAQQAEAKAQQAEAKAHQAEAKAHQAEAKAQQAEAKAQQAEAKAQQAEAKAQQAEAASNQASKQLEAMYSSTSWHLTSPLRWLSFQSYLLKHHGPTSRIKAFARKSLPHVFTYIRHNPKLKGVAIAAAYRLGIAERLRALYRQETAPTPPIYQHDSFTSPVERTLTPRAQQIYRELKNAIENQKAQS